MGMPDIDKSTVTLRSHHLASMPNLAFSGLSENWMLKECGHQHWLALAALYDRPLPDFRDPQGRISYAAFTLAKSKGLHLQDITENRSFSIETILGRAAPNRHVSEQRLLLNERCVGEITLISTFVSRHVPGDNRSIAKACLNNARPIAADLGQVAQKMHSHGKQLRTGDWFEHFRLERETCIAFPPFSFSPCPDVDYNGAELFYFANFQSLVDRAEWSVLSPRRPGLVRQREIYFYGNLNIGDMLQVHLRTGESEQRSRHWCEVFRQSDSLKLADVFTEKSWPMGCS